MSLLSSILYVFKSQTPVLGVTQSDITQYTLNYKLTNETDYNRFVVAAPQTWVRVAIFQLGMSYDAFLTSTNDGGQSNSSESLRLSKQCMYIGSVVRVLLLITVHVYVVLIFVLLYEV